MPTFPSSTLFPAESLFPGGIGGTSLPDVTGDVFTRAIRGGNVAIWYTVDADLLGVPVVGATGLRPVGGTVTDTTKPGVRRTLNLDLAPSPGLFDLLAPTGTKLTVAAHVRLADRSVIDIPMGVFDVDSERLSEGGGGLSLTAPDKWVRIQRARFLRPASSSRGIPVTSQIAALIRGALGASEPVVVTATSTATVGAMTWEKDRAQAINDLAKDIGAWVYFDRGGVATIADAPTVGASADWLVDASESGVLTQLDRERSRADTFNVVVIDSSAASGALFPTQYVWDADPASPTFAAAGPGFGATPPVPGTGGPFGMVPYFYDTPILRTAAAAIKAGRTILARTTGLASQVSLGQVPNPAVDAFDVIDVMPPGNTRTVIKGYVGGSGFGTGPFGESPFGSGSGGRPIVGQVSVGTVLERHIVDTVTHPLTVGAEQRIEGRSTRTDEYVGG